MGPVPQINEFNYIWRKWLSLLSDAIYCPKVTTVADSDMSNSWVTYDANRLVKYWKDAFGVVHLTGWIKTGTIGQDVFTLPSGYRPAADQVLTVTSNALYGNCTITTAGVVNAAVGNNTYFSFDGITFKAA